MNNSRNGRFPSSYWRRPCYSPSFLLHRGGHVANRQLESRRNQAIGDGAALVSARRQLNAKPMGSSPPRASRVAVCVLVHMHPMLATEWIHWYERIDEKHGYVHMNKLGDYVKSGQHEAMDSQYAIRNILALINWGEGGGGREGRGSGESDCGEEASHGSVQPYICYPSSPQSRTRYSPSPNSPVLPRQGRFIKLSCEGFYNVKVYFPCRNA